MFISSIDVIYFIALILSCNVSVFYLLISSFDFWMKSFYALCLWISYTVYNRQTDSHPNERAIVDVLLAVNVLMVIAGSLFERYAVSWKASFGFGSFLSILFSYYATHFTLITDKEEKY